MGQMNSWICPCPTSVCTVYTVCGLGGIQRGEFFFPDLLWLEHEPTKSTAPLKKQLNI